VSFPAALDVPYLHPGAAMKVLVDDEKIGVAGELSPALAEVFKFSEQVFLAEFSLEKLYSKALVEPRYVSPSRFPSVERDLSFLLDKGIEFNKIQTLVQDGKIPGLTDFRLIDLYQGQNLPNDKVSLTVRLTFEDSSRTLTQEEVNERCDRLVAALEADLSIELR
jgi:phenylalanyl-tRNA synthetase beta chain